MLMSLRYDNNFNIEDTCKYVNCDSAFLSDPITSREVFKAVKSLKMRLPGA